MSFGFSISDFVGLGQLAWRITQECQEAGPDFVELQTEALSMHAVLNATQEVIERATPTRAQTERLIIVGKGCRDTLIQIDKMLARYRRLGSSQQRLRDKLRWKGDKAQQLRIQLISHATMLASLNSTITQSVLFPCRL